MSNFVCAGLNQVVALAQPDGMIKAGYFPSLNSEKKSKYWLKESLGISTFTFYLFQHGNKRIAKKTRLKTCLSLCVLLNFIDEIRPIMLVESSQKQTLS